MSVVQSVPDVEPAVHGLSSGRSTSRPLKIVHVTNYQVPGYGYEEIQLSREQMRLGHDVTIVTSNYLHPDGAYSVMRRRFPERQVKPREETVDGVRIRRLSGREFARRVWIKGLERALAELAPDVVHSHNLLQFHTARLALMRATHRSNAAIVIDDHMHLGFVRRTPVGRIFYSTYRILGQPLLSRYIDRFCAIADDTRDYLRTECAVKASIDVVPLGVTESGLMADHTVRLRARSSLCVVPSDLLVVYAGKVIPPKLIHVLVEAAGKVHITGAKLVVAVVGDSDATYEAHLRALAAGQAGFELRLMPSVEHDHLGQWFAAADIGVWPSQESMAVFEAMSFGLPVVVSSSSGLASMVAPERGLTYEAGDADSLAACLVRLANPDLRARLGDAGKEYARRELSWARAAGRYIEIYREAIAALAVK